MRKIFYLFLLHNSGFAQQQDRVKTLEIFFKEFPKTAYIKHEAKSYQYTEFKKLTDTELEKVKAEPLSDWRPSYYAPYYNRSWIFRNILNRIDSLPYSVEGLKNEKRFQIETEIEGLTNPVMQIHAYFYIIDHFLYAVRKDSSLEKLMPNYTLHKIPDFKKYNGAEMLKACGDFYGKEFRFSEALAFYAECLMTYDSLNKNELGKIEEEIAGLYLMRVDNAYRKKSVEHYSKAVKYYTQANNARARVMAKLKKAQILVSLEEGVTLKDVAYESAFLRENKTVVPDIWAYTNENLLVDKHSYILETADYALRKISLFEKENETLAEIYAVLRNYFEAKGDFETALLYGHLTVINTIDFPIKNLSGLIYALSDLANIYSKTNNLTETRVYNDWAIELSLKSGYQFTEALMRLNKAQCLINFNLTDEALEIAQNIFDVSDTTFYSGKEIIIEYCSQLLSGIYEKRNLRQSADFYYSIYISHKADLLQEFELMGKTEEEYAKDKFQEDIGKLDKEYSHLSQKFSFLQSQFLILRNQETFLKGQLKKSSDSLDNVKNHIIKALLVNDSLTFSNERSSKESDSLSKEVNSRKKELSKSEAKLNRTNKYGGLALFVIAVIFLIVVLGNRERIKRKEKKIKDTREELLSLAKRKIHNIRNNYNSFSVLITQNNYEKAKDYADKCAFVFRLSLDKWDWANNNYTLANEIGMLYAVYETERILGNEVNIQIDTGLIKPDEVLFMPEVFPTLLHNSLKSFKGPIRPWEFRIKATRENDFISFEVSDNGHPSPFEQYLKKDMPNKGLTLLENRIHNLLADKKSLKNLRNKFEVIVDNGTTIKFKFPYEAATKNHNS